jgi:hypothetical protein
MKKIFIIRKIFFLLVVMVIMPFLSCKKSFLDRPPLDRLSSSQTFTDKALTEAYLYNLYSTFLAGFTMYDGGGGGSLATNGIMMTSNISDEARNKSDWIYSNTTVVPGLVSATDDPLDFWGRAYQAIRIANNIILNIKTSPYEEAYKQRIESEARFIRASTYFFLARSYGDVPLITELQSLDSLEGLLVKQTPQLDVYNFIDKELGEIGQILPSATNLAPSESGRATREAAWALNGRVLLYAKNYTKSAEFSKKVMDANLFTLNADYGQLFKSYGGNPEVIFEVLYNGAEQGHCFDVYNIPVGFELDYASQMDPTQEMVDAYEMTNGLPITDPASGYDPNDPYKNRDSRLKASIFYQGSPPFKGRALNMVLPDGEQAPNRMYLCSITGYYIRKHLDETGTVVPTYTKSKTSWKELRLGEVLLNYAEAQNEAGGPDQTIYNAINAVRARAQMPDLPTGLSQDEMRQRIIQERRVELAFENFRWYDLIRWKMSKTVLNDKYFTGMFITRNGSGGLVYTRTLVDNRPKQYFLDRNYLLPIPQSEVEKNPNLKQNTGY